MSRFTLITTVACLAACGDASTAPESAAPAAVPVFAAKPNPRFEPFAFTVSNCVEEVDVSGTFHEFEIGDPDRHIVFHVNAKGIGIGRTTGARYQWNDRLFDNDHIPLAGPASFVLNDHTRLIGQGGAPNADFHIQMKVTVNAKGVVVVDRTVVRDTCR
jgi:hypothetical protein